MIGTYLSAIALIGIIFVIFYSKTKVGISSNRDANNGTIMLPSETRGILIDVDGVFDIMGYEDLGFSKKKYFLKNGYGETSPIIHDDKILRINSSVSAFPQMFTTIDFIKTALGNKTNMTDNDLESIPKIITDLQNRNQEIEAEKNVFKVKDDIMRGDTKRNLQQVLTTIIEIEKGKLPQQNNYRRD